MVVVSPPGPERLARRRRLRLSLRPCCGSRVDSRRASRYPSLVADLPGFAGFSSVLPGFREVAMSKHPGEGDHVARIRAALEESARVKCDLAREAAAEIAQAAEWIAAAYRAGGKVLLFGNGGSAADAQHIAAEFTGRLRRDRPALPAIALTANSSDLTAIGNDYGFEQVFSRLIEAHGEEGDVAIAISTSGNSPNLLAAVDEARARRLRTIGLLGRGGGSWPTAWISPWWCRRTTPSGSRNRTSRWPTSSPRWRSCCSSPSSTAREAPPAAHRSLEDPDGSRPRPGEQGASQPGGGAAPAGGLPARFSRGSAAAPGRRRAARGDRRRRQSAPQWQDDPVGFRRPSDQGGAGADRRRPDGARLRRRPDDERRGLRPRSRARHDGTHQRGRRAGPRRRQLRDGAGDLRAPQRCDPRRRCGRSGDGGGGRSRDPRRSLPPQGSLRPRLRGAPGDPGDGSRRHRNRHPSHASERRRGRPGRHQLPRLRDAREPGGDARAAVSSSTSDPR